MLGELPHILLVDQSRVVRASLTRFLQSRFKVQEESDGESAWQSLVLDSRIALVIASNHIQKLDGEELLERLRENRLPRLKRMPFLLMVSDTASEESKAQAKSLGVSGFITKTKWREEILAYLEDFPERPEEGSQAAKKPAKPVVISIDSNEQAAPHETSPPFPTSRDFETWVSQHLSAPGDIPPPPVNVLALGIDNYEALVEKFGRSAAERIWTRLVNLLSGAISPSDKIYLHRPGCCLIASLTASLSRCYSFADRIRSAIRAAQICIGGQPVELTVCAGAAGVPVDGVLSGQELLALAIKHMESKQPCHACDNETPKKTRQRAKAEDASASSDIAHSKTSSHKAVRSA